MFCPSGNVLATLSFYLRIFTDKRKKTSLILLDFLQILQCKSLSMEQIEYTRTVVPSSMRSPYWKYFGFPSDNGNNILTRQKVVCTLCNTAIAYNKNTSNLRTHLIAKHSATFHKLVTNKRQSDRDKVGSKRDSGRCDETPFCEDVQHKADDDVADSDHGAELVCEDFGDGMGAQSELEGCEQLNYSLGCLNPEDAIGTNQYIGPQQQSLECILADMVQGDLLPLDLLRGNGFCKYSQLASGLAVNNDTVQGVMSLLRERIVQAQDSITSNVHRLSHTSPYSLSMECYDDSDGLAILNIYFNFLSGRPAFQLDSILYHSAIVGHNYRTIFEALKDVNLKNCIGIVVNNIESVNDIVAEFAEKNEMTVIECLVSTLERCVKKVFQLPFVAQGFENLCHNAQEEKLASLTPPNLRLRCSWSKLNYMAFIYEHLADVKSNAYLDLLPIYEYVKPLKMALDIISDEQLPLCTLIRPLIVKLFEQHYSDLQTNQTLVQIQNVLHSELKEKYCLSQSDVSSEIPNDFICAAVKQSAFLNEATYFDARFHHEFVLPDAPFNFSLLKTKVLQRFRHIVDIHYIAHPCSTATGHGNVVTNARKSSLKTFLNYSDTHLSSKTDATALRTNFDVEFERYHIDTPIDLDQNTITWWQEHAQIYSELHKVVLNYLAVPCCCVRRLCNLEVEQRWQKLNRRKQLNQYCDIERHLWYLHYNEVK